MTRAASIATPGPRRSLVANLRRHVIGLPEIAMAPHTFEIPRPDWTSVLNALSTAHEGRLVSLEIVSLQLGAQPAVITLPLVGMTFGPTNGGAIMITVGSDHGDRLTHVIQAPQRVALERTEVGLELALAIESGDGATAILRFHAAAMPETVGGVPRP